MVATAVPPIRRAFDARGGWIVLNLGNAVLLFVKGIAGRSNSRHFQAGRWGGRPDGHRRRIGDGSRPIPSSATEHPL